VKRDTKIVIITLCRKTKKKFRLKFKYPKHSTVIYLLYFFYFKIEILLSKNILYNSAMEQNYISNDVFEQIKDFKHYYLNEEQKLLIDKLIPTEELKQRYKPYGLCKGCKQPNTSNSSYVWCQPCNSRRFQQNFKNWTSGNSDVDKLIQESQLNAKNRYEILEWIEYDRFEDIEYIAKGGFGKVYKAIWKDGYIKKWDYETNQWKIYEDIYEDTLFVVLKCLNNSKDITLEFLNEVNIAMIA